MNSDVARRDSNGTAPRQKANTCTQRGRRQGRGEAGIRSASSARIRAGTRGFRITITMTGNTRAGGKSQSCRSQPQTPHKALPFPTETRNVNLPDLALPERAQQTFQRITDTAKSPTPSSSHPAPRSILENLRCEEGQVRGARKGQVRRAEKHNNEMRCACEKCS